MPDSSSDEVAERAVVAKRKRAPKKPKFDFFGCHADLVTIWDELDGAQEATDVFAEQPKDIVLKVSSFS